MSDFPAVQVQTEPGMASTEEGLVILDGPDGVAVTMTANAAVGTARSLLAAAELAAAYDPETDRTDQEEPIEPEC